MARRRSLFPEPARADGETGIANRITVPPGESADAGEHFGGSRAFDRKGRGPSGRVFESHVVGDDVVIEVRVDAFANFGFGIE